MFFIDSRMLFLGVLFLIQHLSFSYANLQEDGCPENLSKYCQCFNPNEPDLQAKNLEFSCSSKRLNDFDFYGFFKNLEQSFAAPDEDDRQEKIAADDSESVLTLGETKPKFSNLNITNSGIGTLDFRLFEQVHFKNIQIMNNKKLRQILRAYRLSNPENNKFTNDQLVPMEVINNFTEKVIIQGSPLLGQGKAERKLFDQLSKLRALKYLTLANNGLKRVPDNAFGEKAISRKIRSIDLKENRIREIGVRSFAGLPSLNRINLDGNELVKLYDSSFAIDQPLNDQVMLIFLRYNKLNENSFEDKTFEGLEKHNLFIYLTGNKLTSLPESVFGPLLRRSPKRTFITLFENPLNCEDCSLRWLYAGKERFSQKVFGAVCTHTQQEIWKLPPNYYEERCE